MRVLACLLLVACGGGSDSVEGEPLIQSTLMAQHDNKPWSPMFGFGRTEGATFELFFGQQEVSCADSLEEKPRAGNYGGTSVPAPVAVGTLNGTFELVEVVGNQIDVQIGMGSVMITAATETQVSGVLGYTTTVDGGQFALTGAFTVVRCP